LPNIALAIHRVGHNEHEIPLARKNGAPNSIWNFIVKIRLDDIFLTCEKIEFGQVLSGTGVFQ